jgi:hypothetical protein
MSDNHAMDKLISELKRLYLLDFDADQLLVENLQGSQTPLVTLASGGKVRALVIDFRKAEADRHWQRLCDVANALQQELGLPAPAVSVSGGDCYRLWLSLAEPVTLALAQRFLALLQRSYFEDEEIALDRTAIELPPCLHRASGLWAAFINPGMGGALAEDLGLEIAPSESAQAAFLEKIDSIGSEQFAQALATLEARHGASVPAATPPQASTPDQLLLRDATLEDIIRHLHAQGIEPTFRHVLKP